MKLNKYIWMAVLPMVFTACQHEVLIEELPMDSALSTITCTIGDEQADSRAQIVLGNKNREQEIFHWNAGDKFTLFQAWEEYIEGDGLVGKYISYTYTIDNSYSNDAPKGYADFTSDRALEQIDKDWIAFYPVTSVDEEITKMGNFCQLRIDNTMTDNSEESWRNYFKNNMYMMTYGDADALSSGVSFEHLCGIVRITYTNATSTDHELNGIYVDGTLGNMQEYEIGGPNHEVQDRGSSNSHGITFTDKATVAAGASEDFYILYFRPTAGPDGEIQDMKGIKVDYVVDGTSSMSQTPSQYLGNDFSYNGFQPGLCSWFKITGLDNQRIVWTRDYDPEDNEEGNQPDYGDIDEATLQFYNDLNNPDIKEIVLEKPIHLSGNIDLGDKTVSLASDFFTKNPNVEAAIFHEGQLSEGSAVINIENGKVNGSTTENNKYVFKLSSQKNYIFNLNGMEVMTEGNLNAICVENSKVRVQAQSKIQSKDGYALDMIADTFIVQAEVNGAEMSGRVHFLLDFNNIEGEYPEHKVVVNLGGKIDGLLEVEGEYNERLKVYIENGTISNDSWKPYLQNGGSGNNPDDPASDENELIQALANCSGERDYTIQIDKDIALTQPLTITKPVILDLCDHTIRLDDNYNNSRNITAVITAEARLEIKNGYLTTNNSTTKLHQYYIENIENLDGVHLTNISLSTGNSGSVINAISGGPNPVSLDQSRITTNGCAIHWGCNEKGMAFSTALRNSSITGDIIFITEKTETLDEIYIESCEISGNLNATLPAGISVTDIFKMDSDTEIASGKKGWDELKTN